ncbi:MAG TPA: ribonuclease Y [Dehalococcoidia bacterium]|nr:ribonuclease Y [Dehalococcoidia bacterium]
MIAIIVAAAVAAVVGLTLGGAFAYLRLHSSRRDELAEVRSQAAKLVSDAETKQKELMLQGKEDALQLRTQAENELKERRMEVQRQERRIVQKEENLDQKSENMDRRDRAVMQREQDLEQTRTQLEELRRQRLTEIERVAQMTGEEAKAQLMMELETEVREDATRRMRQIEQEVVETADERARKIVATAIQRVTSEVTAETTVSVVPIPSDDVKGRIIGREGRNIRALEAATGCDLIIDDTPDAVTLSGFDPVRREIARMALTRLIQDGRIHPTRIEEVVEKARAELDGIIRQAGETASVEAGSPGLHAEVLRTLGRLKYRTSYGQNQLKHAVETAALGVIMANEMGADVNVVRRGCLLHDIGKAIDHDVEGTHAIIGAELARRYGVNPAVVHCIEAHHEEVEPKTVEALIVMIADAVSGGRPGARRESLEHYIKRLEALEVVANAFAGVEKSFAIQAGREIRIIVKPEDIDDLGALRLARDVSKKIEECLEYPGQIKVTVVRETRAVDYAR